MTNNPAHIAHSGTDTADPRRWPALAILLLASFMNLIDVTIVNVALPAMQANLGATSSQIEWVSAAYVLAFALFLLPFGRLGDIIGRKTMFLVGVAVFTLCSALCGIAPSMEFLIGARVLQGIAGAIMTPQVLAIVQVIFPMKERSSAFSFFGLTAGLASVAGPLAGGSLIAANFLQLDWRPIFLVNIPIGLVAVILGIMFIPATKPNAGLKNDFPGIVLFGIAMVALVFPLIEGRAYGWPLWAFGSMVLAVVVGVLFFLWEKRQERRGNTQLLPVALLRNRNFVVGTVMSTLFFSAIPGLFMVLALFFQAGFGLSALESGLTTLPFPIGVLVASFVSNRLGNRFLSWRVAIGSLVLAVGMTYLHVVLSGVGASVDHWQFVGPLLISGFGMGITVSGLFQTILQGVPPRDAGSASGTLQAFQQAGGALGIALVGQIFFATLESGRDWGATSQAAAFVGAGVNASFYPIACFVLVAAMVPLLKRAPRQQAAPGEAPGHPVIVEV